MGSIYSSLIRLIDEAEEKANLSLLQKIKKILSFFPKIKIPSSVKELVDVLVDNLIKMNQEDINKLQNAFMKVNESTELNEGLLDAIKNKANFALVMLSLLILFGETTEAAQRGHRILNHLKSEHVKRDFEKDAKEIKDDLKNFILKELPRDANETLQKVKEGIGKAKSGIESGIEKTKEGIGKIKSEIEKNVPSGEKKPSNLQSPSEQQTKSVAI